MPACTRSPRVCGLMIKPKRPRRFIPRSFAIQRSSASSRYGEVGQRSTENRRERSWSWPLNSMGRRLPPSTAARCSHSTRPSRSRVALRDAGRRGLLLGEALCGRGCHRPSSAAGSRTNTACHGKWCPRVLPEMLSDPDAAKSQRAMAAMLQMKKIDIDALTRAYEGR